MKKSIHLKAPSGSIEEVSKYIATTKLFVGATVFGPSERVDIMRAATYGPKVNDMGFPEVLDPGETSRPYVFAEVILLSLIHI
jgi:hypothetical protein